MAYITTTDLANALRLRVDIPSWDSGSTPSSEEVGTGDNSATIFYLDQRPILASSYTISYGATASSTTNLTETTHYTLDKSKGKITLTASGVTTVGTNKIFAEYSYIKGGFTNEYLSDVIDRASVMVDDEINSVFTDGTATNPSYPSVTETQPSQTFWNTQWFAKNRPLIDIVGTLGTDITNNTTSIALSSGDGAKFPTSGKVLIGTEIISYTGIGTDTLTGCSRGQLTSTASTHSQGDEVHSTILQYSTTAEGQAVSWNTLAWDSEFFAEDTGKIYIYEGKIYIYPNSIISNISADVPNRLRTVYYYGYDTIPSDIKRLTILFAKKMLVGDNIDKSLLEGRDEFNPEMFNASDDEINKIASKYRILEMRNT